MSIDLFNSIGWILGTIGLAAFACQNPAAGITTERTPPVQDVSLVLDRMEQAGAQLRDLSADVAYSVLQTIKINPDDPDEVQNYQGNVLLIKSPTESAFMVHFDEWNDGINRHKNQQWYVFDGHWLIEAKEPANTIVKRELASPGEKSDPFKLGEGPVPLPLGEKKDEILKHFDIVLAPPAPDDPESTDHLLCTPKSDSRLAERYSRIELFISNSDKLTACGLPIRVVLHDKKENTRKSAVFSNVKKNSDLKMSDFQLPSKTKSWPIELEPLNPPKKP